MINDNNHLCQFLAWDSEFFNYRIGRTSLSRLDQSNIGDILDWCEKNVVDCLYFLADSDDPKTIDLAQKNGFSLVEIRITLERSLKDWNPETRPRASNAVKIRAVQPEDIPALQEIAGTSYIDSRFYFDKHFSEAQWQAYYATWVKKSCLGGADLALAAEMERIVVGYITGLVVNDGQDGIYELTGVLESARNAGVGQELFRSGLDWYARSGIDKISVATQGRNITTQRMIQKHGFLTRTCQLYYHKWFAH